MYIKCVLTLDRHDGESVYMCVSVSLQLSAGETLPSSLSYLFIAEAVWGSLSFSTSRQGNKREEGRERARD